MRSNLHLTLVAATLIVGLAHPVSAQQDGVVSIVTYIEAVPAAAAQARDMLEAYAQASRRADNNLQFQALQRIGRPNHFAILEAWTNAAAYEIHSSSANTGRFRESLVPLLYSPPDQRNHTDLVTGARDDAGDGAVYVLTHVDVFPQGIEQVVESLRTLAEASRGEAGNLRFDVLVTDRRNHMTVVEVWQSASAHDAHLGTRHNRVFRTNVAPVHGALYDERLYRGL